MPPRNVYCSHSCKGRAYSRSYKGTGNPRWRDGRSANPEGRVLVYCPGDPHATLSAGKYAYRYRLVASEKIGRPLRSDEVVHHVNGDKTDDRPENLVVLSQSEHMRLEMAAREVAKALRDWRPTDGQVSF